MTNKDIGKYGEELAKDFLTNKGYEILEMNYRYSRIAEIDIIAAKSGILHFIEVKTRTQEFFGSPLEAITTAKLRQIFSCAISYLSKNNKKYKAYKIDAIGIVLNGKEIKKIDFIEDISL